MTKKRAVERGAPTIFEAKVPQQERYQAWSAPVWRALGYFLEFLPSYRDSRQGRKTAAQIRVVMIGAGIALMAFGGEEWTGWIVIGAILAFSAFAVPMKELKKRSLRARFKTKAGPRLREVFKAGSVRIDDRRVELWVGDEKRKQVRIDRDRHEVIRATYNSMTCLGVRPRQGRKSETIWVCSPLNSGSSEPALQEPGLEKAARIPIVRWPEFEEALGVKP